MEGPPLYMGACDQYYHACLWHRYLISSDESYGSCYELDLSRILHQRLS